MASVAVAGAAGAGAGTASAVAGDDEGGGGTSEGAVLTGGAPVTALSLAGGARRQIGIDHCVGIDGLHLGMSRARAESPPAPGQAPMRLILD